MRGFRVIYRQGSFVLSKQAKTRAEALVHALSLQRTDGVWHVHIEDGSGRPVLSNHELAARCGFYPPPISAADRLSS